MWRNLIQAWQKTSSSELRTKTASSMHKGWILVAWINDGRPSFLLWLSLEKEFEGAAGAILPWISFELWNSLADCTMGSCGEFSFKYRSMALCTSLRDSRRLVSVSFCDLSVTTFLRRRLFQDIDIFFKMAGSGLAPASEDVRSFTVLLSGSKDHICLFTATELRSYIASFETTRNLETCTFLWWLWICCRVSSVYALLDAVSYGSWADVEEKTPKLSSK